MPAAETTASRCFDPPLRHRAVPQTASPPLCLPPDLDLSWFHDRQSPAPAIDPYQSAMNERDERPSWPLAVSGRRIAGAGHDPGAASRCCAVDCRHHGGRRGVRAEPARMPRAAQAGISGLCGRSCGSGMLRGQVGARASNPHCARSRSCDLPSPISRTETALCLVSPRRAFRAPGCLHARGPVGIRPQARPTLAPSTGIYAAASSCTAASSACTPRSKVASHCARWKYGAAAASRGHSLAMKAPSTGSAADGPLA